MFPSTYPWKWRLEAGKVQMQVFGWTGQHRADMDRDMEGSTEQDKMCLQETVIVIVPNNLNIVSYFMNTKSKHLNGIFLSLIISQRLIITYPKFIL